MPLEITILPQGPACPPEDLLRFVHHVHPKIQVYRLEIDFERRAREKADFRERIDGFLCISTFEMDSRVDSMGLRHEGIDGE